MFDLIYIIASPRRLVFLPLLRTRILWSEALLDQARATKVVSDSPSASVELTPRTMSDSYDTPLWLPIAGTAHQRVGWHQNREVRFSLLQIPRRSAHLRHRQANHSCSCQCRFSPPPALVELTSHHIRLVQPS